MESIEKLLQTIREFNSIPQQSIQLNPVLSLKQVEEIEVAFELSFPDDYTQFVTQIGDGGIINSKQHGCLKLQSLGKYQEEGYSLKDAKIPFSLTRSWMPDWGDGFENAELLDEDTLQKMYDEQWEIINNNGHITIMEYRTVGEMQWLLILTGPRKGEVWVRSEFGVLRLINCSFFQWLQLLLDGKMEAFLVECKKIEYPCEPNLIERCKLFFKKNKIVMKPRIDIFEIEKFQEKHNISFPDEYVCFLAEIGNGSIHTPWYIDKIHSLSDFDCLDNLDQPFFIQTEEEYKTVFLDEKGGNKIYNYKNPIWKVLFGCNFNDKGIDNSIWLLPQFQLLQGCIPIMDKGNPKGAKNITKKQFVLILNGYCKGQIWSINEYCAKPTVNLSIDGVPINIFTFVEAAILGII